MQFENNSNISISTVLPENNNFRIIAESMDGVQLLWLHEYSYFEKETTIIIQQWVVPAVKPLKEGFDTLKDTLVDRLGAFIKFLSPEADASLVLTDIQSGNFNEKVFEHYKERLDICTCLDYNEDSLMRLCINPAADKEGYLEWRCEIAFVGPTPDGRLPNDYLDSVTASAKLPLSDFYQIANSKKH